MCLELPNYKKGSGCNQVWWLSQSSLSYIPRELCLCCFSLRTWSLTAQQDKIKINGGFHSNSQASIKVHVFPSLSHGTVLIPLPQLSRLCVIRDCGNFH